MGEDMDKEGMLRQIDCISFMVTDLALYLDTHPCDKQALKQFMNYKSQRKQLLKEFAQKYYPLTMDCCEPAPPDGTDTLDRASDECDCKCVWFFGNGSESWKGSAEPAAKTMAP